MIKCVPHVQHDYFSSLNQSDHCFLTSSLPSSLRKLPIDFLHRPLEEYQKFTAYTSPGVGVGVAFSCDARV